MDGKNKSIFRSRVFVGCFSALAGLAMGAQAEDRIAALRNDYAGQHAFCKVKVDGLHATTDVLGCPSEMRVVDGVVSRGASRFIRGGDDTPVASGRIVRVIGIEEADTPKKDVLRVTIAVNGAAVPIAFMEPHGNLATMTEAQLQSLVGEVLEPLPVPSAPSPLTDAPPSAPAASSTAVSPGKAVTQAQTANPEPQRTPLPSENVVDLDGILKKHNGDAILKVEGVHAAFQSPDYTRDNVIIDGVFQPRRVGGVYRGMRDVVLWPNSHVQFVQLSAFTDDQHDILHLVIRADVGAYAPLSFLLPKDELSTFSKKKIMEVVGPFVVFAAADAHTFDRETDAGTSSRAGAAPPHQQDTALGTSLHASHPPNQGCLWVPYVSKKFGLELLIQQCGGGNDGKFVDTPDGIGETGEGGSQTVIRVFTKPATETTETAIYKDVILKFKDPAAHANCKAVETGEEQPGWHEYQVKAFGPYAHPQVPKSEELEKGDGLCEGFDGADVTTVFLYNPEVSKTRFFGLYGLSDPVTDLQFDILSLRSFKVEESAARDKADHKKTIIYCQGKRAMHICPVEKLQTAEKATSIAAAPVRQATHATISSLFLRLRSRYPEIRGLHSMSIRQRSATSASAPVVALTRRAPKEPHSMQAVRRHF